MHELDQLRLWKHLKDIAPSPETVANTEALIKGAADLLDRVIETFPTYTLHNRQHAFNVARLMGELLGENGVADLTALESTMLLLSAYFHDIGMVLTAEERASLAQEPEWKAFLDAHAEAYLAVEKDGTIPLGVAEWYCRWRHADRVFSRLNTFPAEKLHWDAVLFREDLGALCKSHNESVKDLQNLDANYLGDCDLRFCAILLRLSDILDFDCSRAPGMVYRFLGLEQFTIGCTRQMRRAGQAGRGGRSKAYPSWIRRASRTKSCAARRKQMRVHPIVNCSSRQGRAARETER